MSGVRQPARPLLIGFAPYLMNQQVLRFVLGEAAVLVASSSLIGAPGSYVAGQLIRGCWSPLAIRHADAFRNRRRPHRHHARDVLRTGARV
jgi:hypothetical protein